MSAQAGGGQAAHARRNLASIEALARLRREGREPDEDERRVLAGFSGFGSCPDIFSDKPEWAGMRSRLESLLTESELASARSSVLTSYYTPKSVIDAIYDSLAAMGFGASGHAPCRALEPACGTGNFMGAAHAGFRLTGIEVDPLSAELARALNPGADIVCAPFEECSFPEGSFDAVVGNVPFSDSIKIRHPEAGALSIHDYFLLRSLDAVRAGGVVAVVASRFVLDKRGGAVRRMLAERAELVAAVRLPEGAFRAQANTEAIADVLIFRKREEREAAADEPWLRTTDRGGTEVNAFIASDPDAVAGELRVAKGPFGPTLSVVDESGEDAGEAASRLLRAQIGRRGELRFAADRMAPRNEEPYAVAVPKASGDNEYVLDERGNVWLAAGDDAELLEPKRPGDAERLAGMVRLRDAVRATLELEADPLADDDRVEESIAGLRREYERFVALHGRVSSKANLGLYDRAESSYYLLSGLEVLDSEGAFLRPADVFEKRVVDPRKSVPERVEDAQDALAYSLDRRGGLDVGYVAGLLGTSEAGALDMLGDLVVRDPRTGEAVLAEEYLTGDLGEKKRWLQGEIALLRREEADASRACAEGLAGIDRIEPPDNAAWTEFRELLEKEGVRAALTDPDGCASYADPLAALDSRHLRNGRYRACGPAALRDLLRACAEAGSEPDPEAVRLLSGRGSYWATDIAEGEAYKVHLACACLPGSASTLAAVIEGQGYAEGVCRACGDPARGEEAKRRAAELLARSPALSEYMLKVAVEEHGGGSDRVSQLTYEGSTAEGYEGFRSAVAEAEGAREPDPERSERMEGLEKLLRRVESAVPPPLTQNDVALTLGSHWVPPRVVHEFAVETFGLPRSDSAVMRRLTITRTDEVGSWKVGYSGITRKVSTAAQEAYGTSERNCFEILNSALNASQLVVMREGEDGVRERDHAATIAALDKRRALVDRFKEWAFEDPARAERLCRIYNERFNVIAPRTYDGGMLSLPGKSALVELTKHQKDAIARCLFSKEGSLIAHVVGAGKTYDGIAATHEAKRLGKAEKPLIVVPNHLTGQWAADYMRLYPQARILVMGRDDMRDADTVKRFWGRAATGDWDAVIVAQSRFGMVPVSPGRRLEALEQRKAEFVDVKLAAEREGRTFSVKAIEALEKTVESKMERLRAEKGSQGVYFDRLGFDMLVVDEAHNYKNLAVATPISVAGISVAGSQKCEDLLDKCDYIREKHPSNIVFLTGTPVSNSMSELYNMQRYLAPGLLEAQGLSSFSAWASTFGEVVDSVELKPEGTGFQVKQRFSRFHNLPELMSAFHAYADVKTNDDIALDVPECEIVPVAVDATPEQREHVEELARRAEAVRSGSVDPDEDNLLKITGDGRKVALDPKLLDPDGDSAPLEGGKVAACARNVREIWERTAGDRGCQLVFCDTSTPASGKWNVYGDLKRRLVESGVPEAEVAFAGDAATPKQKEALFESVREGRVRVLLGSTQKLGTGTNVQTRLVAVHDLDCPWRPSDLEQRLGRIVRRGNLNERVRAYRYVTVGTFDSYLYQTVQNKQAFVSQVFTSKSPVRSATDLDETVLSYAEIKALATGDPEVQRRMEAENRLGQLRLLKTAAERQKAALRARIDAVLAPRVETLRREYEDIRRDEGLAKRAPAQKDASGAWCGMKLAGKPVRDREEAAVGVLALARDASSGKPAVVGEYRGFAVALVRERASLAGPADEYVDKPAILGGALHIGAKPVSEATKGASSVISQLDRLIEDVATKGPEARSRLEAAEAELGEARRTLASPWKHAEELGTLEAGLSGKAGPLLEAEGPDAPDAPEGAAAPPRDERRQDPARASSLGGRLAAAERASRMLEDARRDPVAREGRALPGVGEARCAG